MCDFCNQKFQEKASLWLHCGQFHSNNSNDQPEFKFKKGYPQNLEEIDVGKKVIKESNLFECNQCDKKFKKKGFLERHISIIHGTEITKPEKRYKFEFLDGKLQRSQLFTNKNKGKLRGISRKCGRRRSLKIKFFKDRDVDMIKDITETYYENGERASDKVNAATRILNNMLKLPESGPLVIPKPTGLGDTVDTFDKVCGYNLENNKPQDQGMC